MRVFLTGATGFVGSQVLMELLANGHEVIGLTRSGRGATWLESVGAQPHRGDLEDLDSLRRGAAASDAVVHTAFDHDFANYAANCDKDGRVIRTLGSALLGSDRKLLITSAVGMGAPSPGALAREDVLDLDHPIPRLATELAGAAMSEAGVKVTVVRLPQVHDTLKQGLISPLIEAARERGVSAYVGEGATRWSAAHVSDVARLYRLALEHEGEPARYHAVAEEGVSARDIASAIGEGLGVPVISLSAQEAPAHFGWLAPFSTFDMSASSEWTQSVLDWRPMGPDLLSDLRAMDYGAVS